jgi:hypothetical protein
MLKSMKCRSLLNHANSNRSRSNRINSAFYTLLFLLSLTFLLPLVFGQSKRMAREEGQFDILVGGKEIGREKFTIISSLDSVSSNSIVDFRDPSNRHQSVRLETHLDMNGEYVPQAYRLETNVDGQKGTIAGAFLPNEATFEYQGSANPRKRGLPVGDRYIVLDTNVFHHFIFVARLFDFSAGKSQSIEAVIPQELDGGMLKVSDAGVENISAKGKKLSLHHLKVDTGMLQIDLWVDDQRVLYKIALPVKQIEVIRN